MDTPQFFNAATQQNTLANGAILVDDWDPIIFDDVLRESVIWPLIRKDKAVGDFTNGIDQTAVGNARAADKRAMSYTAASPTRAVRTPQEIKAIVRDLTYGLYDRSVYAQQGRKFGNLEAKDVRDCKISCLRFWNTKFYTGDTDSDPLEFNGLGDSTMIGSGTGIGATVSIVKTIKQKVVDMMNTSASAVMPSHILVNAQVREWISREYSKAGSAFHNDPVQGSPARSSEVQRIDTAAGPLPLIVDRFLGLTAGTLNLYPTYIITADKLSWQYIEPLGYPGADPQTFEIAATNALDIQHKTVMFGALELLGGTTHHARLNFQARDTVVDMNA